jgi:hypothetical protein
MNKLPDESKIPEVASTQVSTMHYDPSSFPDPVTQTKDVLAIIVKPDHHLFIKLLFATDALQEDWPEKQRANVTWFRIHLVSSAFKNQKLDALIKVQREPKSRIFVSLPILRLSNCRWVEFEDQLTTGQEVNHYLSNILDAVLETCTRRYVINCLKDPNYEGIPVQEILSEATLSISAQVSVEYATIEPEKEEEDDH